VLIDLPGWGESTAGARLEQFTIEAMGRAITGVLPGSGSLSFREMSVVAPGSKSFGQTGLSLVSLV
jgi:hypothetical protein